MLSASFHIKAFFLHRWFKLKTRMAKIHVKNNPISGLLTLFYIVIDFQRCLSLKSVYSTGITPVLHLQIYSKLNLFIYLNAQILIKTDCNYVTSNNESCIHNITF